MSAFLSSYIETALWSGLDDNCDPLDKNYSASDLAPETLARMAADCARFSAENAELLAQCAGDSDRHGGHDFWLTRNHHGAGFWDAYKGEPWPDNVKDKLTDAAHAFGECDLYAGNDGKLHLA